MIKRLKYHEIDFKKYNGLLEKSEQHCIFFLKNYLDSFGSNNWEFLVFNDYEAMMPIFISKKLGCSFVTRPLGVQQLGIISQNDSSEINTKFYQFLIENFRVHFYPFNEKNSFNTTALNLHKNYVIPRSSYEKVKAAYTVDRRRNVRILDKNRNRISFVEIEDISSVKDFFYQNSKGIEPKEKDILFSTYLNFQRNGLLKSYALYFDGEVAGTAFLLEDKENLYAVSLINSPKYLQENAPSIIIDQILQRHIEQKNFSFMGGNMEHIETFFRRFGAEKRTYAVIERSKKALISDLLKFR